MNKKFVCIILIAILYFVILNYSFGQDRYYEDYRIKRYIHELHDRKTAIKARANLSAAGSLAVPPLLVLAWGKAEKRRMRLKIHNR